MAHPVTISSPAHRSGLDRRLVSGVAWTAAAKFGSQIITWGCLLLLARLLSPADFGIVSMSTIFTGFVNIVAEFGIGSAILVMRELTENQIRQTNALSAIVGFGIAGITVLAAKPMAMFFHKPELFTVVAVMGLGFAMSGFRVVPQALLARDIRFKTISSIEAGAVVIQSFISLLLAWLGLGYWALIIGSLTGGMCSTLRFCFVSRCRFERPKFRQVREQLAYSQRILVSRAAWYAYSNADFVVAGRILGGSALGVYTMAWNLANAPVDKVVSLILRITPSVFSAVQHDRVELKRYLRVVSEGMALLLFPVGFGIALVAGVAVPTLFDKRWAGAAMPVSMLAICAVVRCLVSVFAQVQETIRDVRYTMWQSLVCLAVLPASFWYGSRWGANGIAMAWLTCYPILCAPLVLRTLHKIQMGKREYLKSLSPAGVASMVMTGAVLSLHHSTRGLRPSIQLMLDSGLGVAIYAGVLLLFFRSRVDTFLALAKRQRPTDVANETSPVQATT